MVTTRFRAGALLGAICLLAVTASAAPGDDPTVGPAVFTGATEPHATSLEINPAAMPLGQPGNHLYLSGSLVLAYQTVARSSINVTDASLTPGDEDASTTFSPAGSLAYWNASRNVAFGVVVSTAPGDAFADESNAPNARFSSTGGRYRTSNLVSVALAYGITPSIFVGSAFSITRSHLDFGFARDSALADGRAGLASDCGGAPCGLENPEATEYYEVDVTPKGVLSTDNYVVTAGIAVEVVPRWWLAVAYKSAPRVSSTLELTGSARITQAPRDGGAVLNGSASVFVRLPSSVEVGLRGPIARGLELIVGGRWDDLSRLSEFDVRLYGREFEEAGVPEWLAHPRGYRDPIKAWAGVEQIDFGQRLLGGARISMATPSINSYQTSPSTIDGWNVGLSLGAQLRIGRGFTGQLTYTGRWLPPVDVTASAYNPLDQLDCIDADYDFETTACENVRRGYAAPTNAGSYGRTDHALRLGVRYDW